MLPRPLYELLPYLSLAVGLGLLSSASQPGLLLAGLLLFVAGARIWSLRSNYRRRDRHYQVWSGNTPEWLYEGRPFALILLGLLLLRLGDHPLLALLALAGLGWGLWQWALRYRHRLTLLSAF
ncbi:hypothetical protein [Aeromonas schubertii]|uniref:hypothetical protein n=1 Tax=Aeromonas schubertii TaxID=652 RepID=UPI0010A80B19|nr:hypothetical protein [Aeromonas schubertii]QCG48722.1 hypothetical protein E2P79_13555 [Aeromonas schubertii]